MSIIIQKLLFQVTFVLLLAFYLIGKIIGLPSPSELPGGAPKILGEGSLSFEMSVIIQTIFVGDFCSVIGQIIGLPSPSELTGGAPKILR